MAKAATIYDVAERAGVSISTVSNALNRPDRVSTATREKVLAAADDLGFVPRPAAVSQARRAAGCIAVLAPFSSYASYYTRLSGVLEELRGTGVDIRVVDIESAATATSPVLAASAIRGSVDGVVVMGERIDEDVERRLAERALPTVVVDARSDTFSAVTSDDYAGGTLAARHLLGLGHRRLGYLTERQKSDYESQARCRLDGFRHEVDAVAGTSVLVVTSGPSIEEARDAARQLLQQPERPTAIMAHYDDVAIGALHAARDLGLRVPDDVSIMGYDDGPAAVAVDLTTVRQPFMESGAAAVQVLRRQMATGRLIRSVVTLDCHLVVRGTTAPAR
jgi:LacI family transcriptional regulator